MEIAYTIQYIKRAARDIQLLKTAKLRDNVIKLCESLVINPIPLNSKALIGNLELIYNIELFMVILYYSLIKYSMEICPFSNGNWYYYYFYSTLYPNNY